jgi:hypothetical protein
MSTLENADDSPTGRHAHRPSVAIDEMTDRCPLCGQKVTKEEYTRITRRMRARLEQAEKTLKESFERQVKAEAEKARREAARAAEAQIKALKATQHATLEQRLKAERETFEKKIVEAVNSERVKGFEERTKLDEKLQELQRRLQKNRSIDLGNDREVEVFELLKNEFTGLGDSIKRTGRGKSGSDIHHSIMQNGIVVAKIIFETKNTARWMNTYVAKLRRDQLAEQADHAVLVTTVFPAGMHEVGLMDGVIIAAPQRVIALTHLLRNFTLQMHLLRASSEVRAEKTERLYGFLASNRAARLWAQISQAANEMIDLDRAEATAHQKTWGRRGDLIKTVTASTGELLSQIHGIIGGTEASI